VGVHACSSANLDAHDSSPIWQLTLNTKALSSQIDGVDKKLTAQIDGIDKKLTAQIDGVDKKLTAQIEALRAETLHGFAELRLEFQIRS
jgi:hypothetical protein